MFILGLMGKFVVNNVSSKFTYNVLNNSEHPYANANQFIKPI